MKVILLILTIFLILGCEMNPFEKPKKTKEDKAKIFLQEYTAARTFAGRYFMGDPLCGGDPIGTMLGLNNDILKYTVWEIGKTYEYETDQNPVEFGNNIRHPGNWFLINNTINSKIEVKMTLLSDNCLSPSTGKKGVNIYAPYECKDRDLTLTPYLTGNNTIQCNYASIADPSKYLTNIGENQWCIYSGSQSRFYISVGIIYCKIKFEIKGVG